MGNGNSLKDVPFEFLHAYPTFGTNKVFLLKGFTPNYYVAINPDIIPFVDEINKMDCIKYISSAWAGKVYDAKPVLSVSKKLFYELPSTLWEGYGVTYCCLQIAYWLDFKNVLLVGVDHRYSNDTTKGNHFCDEYEEGIPVIHHDLEKLMPAYKLANEAYKKAHRRIINLTPNSALSIFEKGSIDQWLR